MERAAPVSGRKQETEPGTQVQRNVRSDDQPAVQYTAFATFDVIRRELIGNVTYGRGNGKRVLTGNQCMKDLAVFTQGLIGGFGFTVTGLTRKQRLRVELNRMESELIDFGQAIGLR